MKLEEVTKPLDTAAVKKAANIKAYEDITSGYALVDVEAQGDCMFIAALLGEWMLQQDSQRLLEACWCLPCVAEPVPSSRVCSV